MRRLLSGCLRGGILLRRLLLLQLLPQRLLGLQLLLLLGQALQLPACGIGLLEQAVHLLQLALQVGDLLLQHRDLTGGAVAPAAVQLLLQPVPHLGVGHIFLTGGNERGDAPFQLCVAVHRQRALPDKSAALKDLPGDTQQCLAGILAVDTRHSGGGIGVGAGKVTHGGVGPAGVPAEGKLCAVAGCHLYLPPHGGAAPRRKAVFVRQQTPVPGVETVQHDPQKVAPCGFSRFIGGVNAVQPRLQGQLLILQLSECGAHFPNLHVAVLLTQYIIRLSIPRQAKNVI